MIVLVISLALAAPAEDGRRLGYQMMTSRTYDTFAHKADRTCPFRKLRYLHPADLGDLEEDFLPTLPRGQRHRVALADTGLKGCAPAGMSCPAQHTLSAIDKAGSLDKFVRFACSATD